MSQDYHTPYTDGVTEYKASDMNSPLGELDNILGEVSGEVVVLQVDVDGFPAELKNLVSGEIQQLENINNITISVAQWEYLGAMDQGVSVASTPTFQGINLTNEGLHILDTNASHDLIIKPGSDLTADRILSIVTGDAARTVTLSGDPTLDDWFDQAVKQASTPIFDGVISRGTEWTIRTSAIDNDWYGVCYGNGLFVAVAGTGTDNRVMTSPDGITWTIRTSAVDNGWVSVTYGNGLFVAVANSGTDNRVMTSPDGITWTIRTSAVDNGWYGVCYGNGLFVAVAYSGTGNRVMTSPDGITWTIRTSAVDNGWYGVCYGNGLFVAVAGTGTDNRVMTSPDGITWTIRTSAVDNNWYSVCYGNGLFVAVANSGTGNRVMTSPDGITWTIRTSAVDNNWYSVCYGNGLFVAVAYTGTDNRVMTSPDGITWTIRTSAVDNNWRSVIYGNGLFVAVAVTGVGNRVMTSGKSFINEIPTKNTLQGGRIIYGSTTIKDDLDHDGSNIGFFGTAPAVQAAAYTPTNVTPDRSYDADTVAVAELADIVGTLISDLQSYGLLQ